MATAGLLLVSAFAVADQNAGLALAIGGTLSFAAIARGVSEQKGAATATAAVAAIVFIVTSFLRLTAK